ncbi:MULTISPECIES: kelch repeat-containing protein [Bizionia]|uniref:DUF6242 domain-containing protein n=1 Tax=Bizionia algoritergicola TaxID=291187 RepID=A0A5D0QMN7_9FLAO|nr:MULTISPECIES: kelch repeat-containing protein [Bizionia]OBX21037.1 hypothetical protein BAA08_14365 [Bizionia sp. APA-3]TYB70059.1 hypothetical protein ES675_15880 [Bizionia algoritergicola]
MKKNTSFLLKITLILILFNCGGDDDVKITVNKPPNPFSLLTISNEAVDVDLIPTLAWNMAVDPDGDPVTYDLVLDTNTNPNTIVASNLSETEFTFSVPLQFLEVFYWKVIAKDNQGNSTESDVFSFTTIDLNRPPNPFLLLTVSNEAVDVKLKPTLTWNVAVDPDDDPVTYDLVLDNNINPNTIIASNLSETEFTFSVPLQFLEVFYWKVIAKDNQGNSTESDVFSFTTADLFSQITANAQFIGRIDHETVVFNNKMWVIGGSDVNVNQRSDVWSSTDGINWTEATSNAAFSSRASHTALTFDGKIWVIGGYSGGNKNDVWSSVDGTNWTQMTANASFIPRYAHTSVVFDNKMWVIGGEVGSLNVLNDIWHSVDGINWIEVNAIGAPEKGRHTAVVHDNKIWLIAGLGQDGTKNDVWNSSDGINWTQVIAEAPFTERYYHTTLAFDNKLWVIGGISPGNIQKNDIWSSNDGVNWTEVTSNAPFQGRYLHTSVVHNNNIWVIAGRDEPTRKNDVWSMN